VSTGSETSQAPIGILEDEGDGISGAGHTYELAHHYADGGGVDTAHPHGEVFFSQSIDLTQLTNPASNLALANDPGNGVYALWFVGYANDYDIEYSPDGGQTWAGPEKISDPQSSTLSSVDDDDPTLTGVGGGSFDIAFTADTGTGTVVYLQWFNYGQRTPVTASIAPTATSTSTTVTVTTSGSVTPCTVTTTITTSTTTTTTELRESTGHRRESSATKAKPIILATGRFTITKAGSHLLKLKGNATGRRLIAKHRTLRATVALSTKTAGGTKTSSHALSITRK
jgi:hypothetical protein